MVPMTENERRILSELSRAAPLSKRDITLRCGMGWATAVKLMTRLEEQGLIVPAGSERQAGAGKTATVYSVSPLKPAAIGIDVEYGRARLNIRNLAGACLFETDQATPPIVSPSELIGFLNGLVAAAEAEAARRGIALAGAGIGVPSHLLGTLGVPYAEAAQNLAERLALPVSVDNNIRCFTAGVVGSEADPGSMLVVTVRSGIGAGIVLGGRIYQGDHGAAGEIGHLPVEPGGKRCRCGKDGCLETVVNRAALAADFAAAATGDDVAAGRIERAGRLLGGAIATAMLVLDVRRAVVFAELGADGRGLEAAMRAGAAVVMPPESGVEIRYETLDPEAYVAGAARLVLNDFVR
jgi:predicted NBD/HSP70 family sugar kinase